MTVMALSIRACMFNFASGTRMFGNDFICNVSKMIRYTNTSFFLLPLFFAIRSNLKTKATMLMQ